MREREILRVAATVDGEGGDRSATKARKEVLKWVRKRVGAPLPKIAWEYMAGQCLLWLANDYRQARLQGGNAGDLRELIEGGLWNDRCGADAFGFDRQGKRFDVEWRIKSGGNTRDPRRCLRIYCFWDEASERVVIASMPAHIRTGAT